MWTSSALLSKHLLILSACLLLRGAVAQERSAAIQTTFGELWRHVSHLDDLGRLESMIASRRAEIEAIKEHWKDKPLLQGDSQLLEEVEALIERGTLTRALSGRGGTYLLSDDAGLIHFVIKPFDEDVLCLNNPKGHASPYHNEIFRMRGSIPLYRSMLAETLAFHFAQILDLTPYVPKTTLGIVSHPAFFDISQRFPHSGSAPREKLCSIQRYYSGLSDLRSWAQFWIDQKWTDTDLLNHIDTQEVEALFLLIWLLGDTDAHAQNLAVKQTQDGKLHLIKLDSGLAFPDRNERLINALRLLPHAALPPSDSLREKMGHLPCERLVIAMREMEMDGAIDAFLKRASLIKALAQDPSSSLLEIDLRIQGLSAYP